VLKELRPDVVNLCEVEGCDEMEWLARQLNTAEEEVEEGKAGYYNYFLLKGQDTFTVRVVCRCGCVRNHQVEKDL